MRITAPLSGWPSGPLTSPSIAANCAHAAPANSKKQKPLKMYPRNRASICCPPWELNFHSQHTTMDLDGAHRLQRSPESKIPRRASKTCWAVATRIIMGNKVSRGIMSARLLALLVLALPPLFGQDGLSKAE